ncbi:MAG: pitrilysin family protein [Armatimonadetes bacterium]|nr:pitrilysin family protein [Armatimonadota bacterium]
MFVRPLRSAGRLFLALVFIQILAISCVLAQAQGVLETKLDNGLTVIMKEVHAAPVFTAQVWFKAGSRNEHTGITGLSHMLEHMLFNSSKNFKKGEISDMIRKRGGIENAATSTDFTYYWQLLGSGNLEFSLKTLAERVGNALLTDKEFQNERTVVLSELQGNENNPGRLLYYALMAAAFEAHPYHWPTIGWQSDVENVSAAKLHEYYKTYYHPNNATLILVGDFDPKAAIVLVKKYFGSKPAGPKPPVVYTVEPPQSGERTVIVRKQGNAERILMGYHVPAIGSSDDYALNVLNQILSGGRSGKLYQALVEKQLATSAYSSTGDSKDPSLYMFAANARQGVSADKLKEALLEQIEIIKTTLPTDQEMQSAKNQLEASLIFQNDSVSDQGEQLGYYNTITSYKYLNTLIPKIKAVTPEDVKRVANKYFTQENLTVGKFIPTDGEPSGSGKSMPGAVKRTSDKSWEKLADNYKPKSAVQLLRYPDAEAAKPTRVALDNGMVIIVQENHSNPTVAISGYIKAGSYFDHDGKKGEASLTAEMLGRGAAKRSALELARASEFVGASVDTSASAENMSFSAKSLAKDFPLMLDLLSDELRNPTFPQDQFERARGEMLSALEQSKESTDDQASRAFYNSVFPASHPYHRLTVDEARKHLESITRDDLTVFHKAYYRPDTAIIVIAGDVKAVDAVEGVKGWFGDWKADGPTPKVEIPDVMPQTEPKQIVIPMMDKSQVDILYGYALGIKRSSPDYYTVRLMNHILGGGGALGSILGDQIREQQGLVYDIYSTFDATLGAGPWYASLGTSGKNVDKAVASLKSIVKDFAARGATKKQYEQAREFLIGVFPIALETNEGVARTLLNAEFYGLGMDYISNYPKIYGAITLGQVNAAAKKYLHPDAATLVIAGPYQK